MKIANIVVWTTLLVSTLAFGSEDYTVTCRAVIWQTQKTGLSSSSVQEITFKEFKPDTTCGAVPGGTCYAEVKSVPIGNGDYSLRVVAKFYVFQGRLHSFFPLANLEKRAAGAGLTVLAQDQDLSYRLTSTIRPQLLQLSNPEVLSLWGDAGYAFGELTPGAVDSRVEFIRTRIYQSFPEGTPIQATLNCSI